MKDIDQLREGERYSFVSFIDELLLIPEIITYIYVGKNLLGGKDESGADDCYFQEPASYFEHGNFAKLPKNSQEEVLNREEVYIISSEHLSSIKNIEELIEILKKVKGGKLASEGYR